MRRTAVSRSIHARSASHLARRESQTARADHEMAQGHARSSPGTDSKTRRKRIVEVELASPGRQQEQGRGDGEIDGVELIETASIRS